MAAGDLTDLATVHIAANITTSSPATDQVLSALIAAMSAYVPQVLNRNVLADNYLETYDGNGKTQLLLRQRPVIQVSSVAWLGQTVTAQASPAGSTNGIWTDGRCANLIGYCFPRGEIIRVIYSAGFIAVPADISLAVAELVAEAYARRTHVGESSRSANGVVTTGFDLKTMHNAIADKLRGYMHGAPC